MVTWEDVREAYADLNGRKAADETPREPFEAAAAYANLHEIESVGKSMWPYLDERVLIALDVFRLVQSGEFEDFGFKAFGDGNR